MRYRIENVSIPVHAGTAQPGPNDRSQDLGVRRVVHVIAVNLDKPDAQNARVTVLTEEGE